LDLICYKINNIITLERRKKQKKIEITIPKCFCFTVNVMQVAHETALLLEFKYFLTLFKIIIFINVNVSCITQNKHTKIIQLDWKYNFEINLLGTILNT